METTMTTTHVVERSDLHRTRWADTPAAPLPPGGVRMRVDSFALTSNNVTYALFGEQMNYWSFFPTGDAATGCIPVWGFGDVVESDCAEVAVGERFYGYFPLASEVLLQPVRCNDAGFIDGAPHRRDLPPVYNHYQRCRTDPGYDPAREAEQALLRPLFVTSFLIDDFLAANGCFDAQAVLLSSASSKTAYGTAFCLAQRRGDPGAVRVVGLTSAANLAFTRSLGCYDEVHVYGALDALDASRPSVYVDFSGSAATRAAVHARFGASLRYSCAVGVTHWSDPPGGRGLPGPKPVFFFAPAHARQRLAEWGPAGFQQRLSQAWLAFMRPVTDPQRPWLRVERGRGQAAIERVYAELVAGTTDPRAGHLLAF
jgi:hypothetical protein